MPEISIATGNSTLRLGHLHTHQNLLPDADAIVQTVAAEMRPGDVVAILSNGGFGGIYEKLPQRLKSMAGGASGNHPLKASAKA